MIRLYDFKDLPKRTASDKILCNKAFNIAKNPKCYGYQRGRVSLVYKCFDKKSDKPAFDKSQVVVLELKLCQTNT